MRLLLACKLGVLFSSHFATSRVGHPQLSIPHRNIVLEASCHFENAKITGRNCGLPSIFAARRMVMQVLLCRHRQLLTFSLQFRFAVFLVLLCT